jgi:hypothetical protein
VRVASRELPERPRCPRCRTQYAPVVLYQTMSGSSDVVVMTDSCKWILHDTRKRCGQPFAVAVRAGRPPEYLSADNWDRLNRRIFAWIRSQKKGE